MHLKFIDVDRPQIHSCPLMSLVARCMYGSSFNALFLMVSLCLQGVFTFEGKAIDRPLLLQAENIVSLKDTIQMR